MSSSLFFDVKDIYDFYVKNKFDMEIYMKNKYPEKNKFSDDDLIYLSINLVLSSNDKDDIKKVLGSEAYEDYLKLNRPAKYEDITENLRVFDEVMFKYKDFPKLKKLGFLERIIGRSETGIIIPFVSAKLKRKYFSGDLAKEKMDFYKSKLPGLN